MAGRMPGLSACHSCPGSCPCVPCSRCGPACLHAGLFRVGDILGSGLLKDSLSAVPLSTIVCMDGDKEVTLLEFPLVPLGFIFWNTEADQSTRDTPKRRSGCGPAECRHDRSGSDEWP